MDDLAEIIALPSRIQKAVDEGNLEAFADTIAPHCTFAIRRGGAETIFSGKKAILEMTASLTGRRGAGGLVHVVGSVIPEIRGIQTAFVQSTCLYVSPTQGFMITGFGTYADDLVKDQGRWRFSRRLIEMTLNAEMSDGMKL